MEYQFSTIEKKWQEAWKSKKAYQVSNESDLFQHKVSIYDNVIYVNKKPAYLAGFD